MKSGYIYVLIHPSDPDLYKIGVTTSMPGLRLAQHNSDLTQYAGRIVQETGQKWELKEYHAVPDPYWAEKGFWGATPLADIPFRGGIEVEKMKWAWVKAGLDAAKQAGLRPPPKPRIKPVRNRDWMIEQLEGTGITMIGTYRGLVTGVEFRCSEGHVFKDSPGVVAYRRKTCPLCRFWVCHDDSESKVDSPKGLQPIVDALIDNQCSSITLCPVQGGYPKVIAFVSGTFGHLFYLPKDGAAGQVATGMTPEDCPEMVHFQWSTKESGDDFDTPKACVIPAALACEALFEFLADGSRPKSVDWVDL